MDAGGVAAAVAGLAGEGQGSAVAVDADLARGVAGGRHMAPLVGGQKAGGVGANVVAGAGEDDGGFADFELPAARIAGAAAEDGGGVFEGGGFDPGFDSEGVADVQAGIVAEVDGLSVPLKASAPPIRPAAAVGAPMGAPSLWLAVESARLRELGPAKAQTPR